SLSAILVDKFRTSDHLVIAFTPEGSRSRNPNWHTGFLRIAMEADVPVMLAVIDFKDKHVFMHEQFKPSGDVDTDMRRIKQYYAPYQGKYPEKFTAGDE
ncbi:MAG: acyltransferase, partial [Muribaculaceae bacterium]|nr:acyltransferase [Muribaculaceae bacterium]